MVSYYFNEFRLIGDNLWADCDDLNLITTQNITFSAFIYFSPVNMIGEWQTSIAKISEINSKNKLCGSDLETYPNKETI